jgi:hypothetical protein
MSVPGTIDALGVGDALGVIVMPGIGAIVGTGEAFGAAGGGVAFLTGAGVAIGMPGIGAIVGCAARTGETVKTVMTAATLNRVASKRTSRGWATYYAP